jgi:hypothetical protein
MKKTTYQVIDIKTGHMIPGQSLNNLKAAQ